LTELRFASLPTTSRWRVTFEAGEPQRLSPMPTTSLHGALVAAIRRITCLAPACRACVGCKVADRCDYVRLAEPLGRAAGVPGVSDRAPAPFALDPVRFDPHAKFIEMKEGQTWTAVVCLIGDWSPLHRAVMTVALELAAKTGLGIPRRSTPGRRKAQLTLVGVEEEPSTDTPCPRGGAVVTLVSPLRLKERGKTAETVRAAGLLEASVRRANALSVLYGTGPILDRRWEDRPCDVHEANVALERVSVTRYSARQKTRMTWDGLVGELALVGDVQPWWPLLRFVEAVQVGSKTTFGFGKIRLGNRAPR
jgi:hypothetical protein